MTDHRRGGRRDRADRRRRHLVRLVRQGRRQEARHRELERRHRRRQGRQGRRPARPSANGDEKVPGRHHAPRSCFQVPEPKVARQHGRRPVPGSPTRSTSRAASTRSSATTPTRAPSSGRSRCPARSAQASSHITKDDKTAIVFQPKMPSARTSTRAAAARSRAIDLDAGKKLWTKTVNSGDRPISLRQRHRQREHRRRGQHQRRRRLGRHHRQALWSPEAARTTATTPVTAAARSWSRCASAVRYDDASAAHPDHRTRSPGR